MGFEYWDFPGEAAVRECPPASIADNDRGCLEEILREGEGTQTCVGDEMFLVLGLDFGTSSTKMIVRLPYEAGEPAIAIPAPSFCRSEGNPYLWQTVIWRRNDGRFLPCPETGATVLNALKQGLVHNRPGETTMGGAETIAASNRAQAGVACLSFAIRYARGWLVRNRDGIFRGRKPVWLVNIGMPAACYDEPELAGPYRRIGAAALRLANSTNAVTTETTQCFLADREVAGAGASEQAAAELGVAVVPETAAEVMGFTRSARSAPGLYLAVDVGAMTLDASMFRLTRRKDPDGVERDHYLFMTAQVRPLGVESFHWCLDEGRTETEFVDQCNRMLWYTVWRTKRDRDPLADKWKNKVPVFLAGGGATNLLHRNIVKSLHSWLRQYLPESGIRFVDLPIPKTLDLPEPIRDIGRMTAAWGLSYPEIGRVHPAHSIDDIPRQTPRDYDDSFISKDHI